MGTLPGFVWGVWGMGSGEGAVEVVLEKSELSHSAAHHLWLIRSLGGLGVFILTSAPANSHGNHWPQSIWEISQF